MSRDLGECQFAFLTDVIYKTWADKTAKEYKQHKGLKKENLRDNMTNKELVLSMLAELSTKEISEALQPQSLDDHEDVAKRGGGVSKQACPKLEAETGNFVDKHRWLGYTGIRARSYIQWNMPRLKRSYECSTPPVVNCQYSRSTILSTVLK